MLSYSSLLSTCLVKEGSLDIFFLFFYYILCEEWGREWLWGYDMMTYDGMTCHLSTSKTCRIFSLYLFNLRGSSLLLRKWIFWRGKFSAKILPHGMANGMTMMWCEFRIPLSFLIYFSFSILSISYHIPKKYNLPFHSLQLVRIPVDWNGKLTEFQFDDYLPMCVFQYSGFSQKILLFSTGHFYSKTLHLFIYILSTSSPQKNIVHLILTIVSQYHPTNIIA